MLQKLSGNWKLKWTQCRAGTIHENRESLITINLAWQKINKLIINRFILHCTKMSNVWPKCKGNSETSYLSCLLSDSLNPFTKKPCYLHVILQ